MVDKKCQRPKSEQKWLEITNENIDWSTVYIIPLKGKFSSGREGALASKFNYDFK